MVNVPPIPPLLCSTPPPIDFGDEDEDIDADVLQQTLADMQNEDFGDYLAVDDSKSNEPLPSPRPPSEADLPSIGVYDGDGPMSIDKTYTNHEKPMSPLDEVAKTTQETIPSSTSVITNTPIIEALNHSITNPVTKDVADIPEYKPEQATNATVTSTLEQETLRHNVCDAEVTKQAEGNCSSGSAGKDPNKNNESANQPPTRSTITADKTADTLANMVFIEDLEDDLSEDELYSPKTPKNFTEIPDMQNFFAIHEIKNECVAPETLNSQHKQTSNDVNSSQAAANEAKLENTKTFAAFEIAPPPDVEFADDDDDADFGDFADFNDFSSAIPQASFTNNNNNNLVPANNSKTNHLENDFQHSKQLNPLKTGSNTSSESSENHDDIIEIHKKKDNSAQLTSQDLKNKRHMDGRLTASQENNQKNNEIVFNAETSVMQESQESFNESFSEFKEPTTQQVYQIEAADIADHNDSIDCDDDFGDFADFEQHQVTPPQVNPPNVVANKEASKSNDGGNGDDDDDDDNDDDGDDDDDFGDFNTAEPINTSATTTTTTTIPASQPVLKQLSSPPISSQQFSVNLNERISKILQFMFTPAGSAPVTPTEPNTLPKTGKLQDIPFTSIDAAKALEYQWLGSETRHSFIKSLGIDSRNIMYGENWNPTLPRFAANLSFNPLKPMKPITSNSSGVDTTSSCPNLEPVTVSKSDNITNITNTLGTKRDANIELDWKSSAAVVEAASVTEPTADDVSIPSTTTTTIAPTTTAIVQMATSVPYETIEPPISHAIFENPLDGDEKFSKTPPISEMESVNTFGLPLTSLEMDLPSTASQILSDYTRNGEFNELEELEDDTLEVVVASTTFAGSFKETHIYTPPKTVENSSSSTSSTSTTSPSKATSIDFDYEKAAMGVIIDEMVVKKEYRDIEYNSPFSMNPLMNPALSPSITMANSNAASNNGNQTSSPKNVLCPEEDDFNDEFSEFQSVPSEAINNAQVANNFDMKSSLTSSNSPSPAVSDVVKPANVTTCGMILSPAILIPQAISMENQKPKIEWGDSTASINPEELARIEELFPEPKSVKSNNSNSSQKSTPTHQVNPIMVTTPSISAAVANKELESNNDDDDWSDFVSVPITNNNKMITNNNLVISKTPSNSPYKQRSPANSRKTTTPQQQYNNSNNDDEWSDFVSSAPATGTANQQQGGAYRSMPQFNSGAWQNANFYNNPLSLYHKGPMNLNSASNQHNAPKNYINNNNNYTQYNQFQMPGPQQQIHIMQNFSTAPVPTAERHGSAKNNQFQVGSAKVAPSIALIPDLGFVAPAIPTHTSFISSLPKPSINSKK